MWGRRLASAIRIPRCAGFSTETARWDICAAVCLERLPVVTPSLNDIQKKFKSYLEDIEMEKSMKSNHELRHEQDLINIEKLKNDSLDITELEAIQTITAQDFEDSCNDEIARFKYAPFETDADKKNDQTSLKRKLRSHLILLVEQNLGDKPKLILPQSKHNDGETLRQTAERALEETCGNEMKVLFFGNAPCGHMRYKWRENDGKLAGANLFFYYARYLSGQVSSKSQFKWLSRNELTFLPERYHQSITDFLVEERQ